MSPTNTPQALEYVRSGDTLVVTELSRITRSLLDLLETAKILEQRQINLVSLRENIHCPSQLFVLSEIIEKFACTCQAVIMMKTLGNLVYRKSESIISQTVDSNVGWLMVRRKDYLGGNVCLKHILSGFHLFMASIAPYPP